MSTDNCCTESPEGSDRDDKRGNFPPTTGLQLELAPFRLEKLQDYEPGGHHPVQLGDALGHDGRYIAVHKLGHGGSGECLVMPRRARAAAGRVCRTQDPDGRFLN